jgi:dihydrodipicolinate synthase/N-acetylneuraminate lyase
MTKNSFDSSLLNRLKEVHVYVATPFSDDATSIDSDNLAFHLDSIIDRGVKIVAVGGGTGESDALSPSEQVKLAEVALSASAGRALVVASVPGNFGEAEAIIRSYENLGVEIVLALPPLVRGKPVTDYKGLTDYFSYLTSLTDIAIMPYNNQAWPIEMFMRLAENPGIISVKDAMLDPYPMLQAIPILGDRFVWIGNKRFDPPLTHLRYQSGMQAFTSGMANFFPEPELELHKACVAGNWERALELQAICSVFAQLRSAADDAAAVKAAMSIVGYKGGPVRPPRSNIDRETVDRLEEILEQMSAPRIKK